MSKYTILLGNRNQQFQNQPFTDAASFVITLMNRKLRLKLIHSLEWFVYVPTKCIFLIPATGSFEQKWLVYRSLLVLLQHQEGNTALDIIFITFC